MEDIAGIAVQGTSVGGIRTVVELPGWDLAFDLGACPDSAARRSTVLFTHGHVDHMGAIATHAGIRALVGAPPPLYVVPRAVAPDVEALLDTWRRLDRSKLPCRVLAAGPGDDVALAKGAVARPFRTIHRTPSQGYVLWAPRTRLRSDLVGLPPAAIQAARARGEVVAQVVLEPEVAYTGDTRIEALEQEPTALRARLLILEVTFYDGRVSVARAREKGHVHLDEVVERAEIFENQALLVVHRSNRYRPGEARAIMARRLPPDLAARTVLLD